MVKNYSALEKDYLRKKLAAAFAFAIACLLFFTPFMNVINVGEGDLKITGKNLAVGSEIRYDRQTQSELRGPDDITTIAPGNTGIRKGINILALAAWFLGGVGFIVSLLHFNTQKHIATGAAFLAAFCLIVLMVQQNSETVETNLRGTDAMVAVAPLEMNFTFWFYITVITFIVAAILSITLNLPVEQSDDVPPEGAPQLNLKNPGSQDNFPVSPGESELG